MVSPWFGHRVSELGDHTVFSPNIVCVRSAGTVLRYVIPRENEVKQERLWPAPNEVRLSRENKSCNSCFLEVSHNNRIHCTRYGVSKKVNDLFRTIIFAALWLSNGGVVQEEKRINVVDRKYAMEEVKELLEIKDEIISQLSLKGSKFAPVMQVESQSYKFLLKTINCSATVGISLCLHFA